MNYQPTTGAVEFLQEKHKMLDAFDAARKQAKRRRVKVEHGNVAEAAIRGWLRRFLPSRFGVCRGYIVTGWAKSLDVADLPHYDVIVYDALNAPVLWVEDNTDIAGDRRNRAIHAEHVLGVLEVKAGLTSRSAKQATQKLAALAALGDRLPPHFCCGPVFFEVGADKSPAALDNLMPDRPIRGLFGGLILRGHNIDPDLTGELELLSSERPSENHVSRGFGISNDQRQWNSTKSVEWFLTETETLLVAEQTLHWSMLLTWGPSQFATFMFGLLERLRDTYRRGTIRDNCPIFVLRP